MSSNEKAVTLEELQKGDGGSFTIKLPVTIASVGRHRFAYHSCMVCRKKTNQNTEGKYSCAQHPDADTKARYCLRILLKQEDISMWSTAFHDIAESLLGVSVEEFEALGDDRRKTVVPIHFSASPATHQFDNIAFRQNLPCHHERIEHERVDGPRAELRSL